MKFRKRRILTSILLLSIFGVVCLTAAAVASDVVKAPKPPVAATAPVSPLTGVPRIPLQHTVDVPAAQIPVLVYHEMNNGCQPTAVVCDAKDYETVSSTQFTDEMQWLYSQGYHTITLPQYLQWLKNSSTMLLPSKPFLITVDNGIGNFLTGAEATLYYYRYTATADVITGFADGAVGTCQKHGVYNFQPGCPKANESWDLTWQQLQELSPQVYDFQLEAGADGHYVQTYDMQCNVFDACELPGESSKQYETRVQAEIRNGLAEAQQKLGSRFTAASWVVPYSDLGYHCAHDGCPEDVTTGPPGWLQKFAERHFEAVFVQDWFRNEIKHERFRFEIHASTTMQQFKAAIRGYLAKHAWGVN